MIGIEYDAAYKAQLIEHGTDKRAAAGWIADFKSKARRISPREQARRSCLRILQAIEHMRK